MNLASEDVRAGLDAKNFSPHSARVSGITAALNANVPLDVIQEAAGHANVQATLRYSRARKRLFGEATAAMPFQLPPKGGSPSSVEPGQKSDTDRSPT